MVNNSSHKKVLVQEEIENKKEKEPSQKSKKRKIALLSDDVDFVRGKTAGQSDSKPLNVEPDNIFVSFACHFVKIY